MEFKELLLLYLTIQGFASYLPQIVRLIVRKSSEDVSVGSWFLWSSNSVIYLIYLIMSTENVWLVLSQTLEVILIGSPLVLILITRRRSKNES